MTRITGSVDGDDFQEIDFWAGISFAAGSIDVSLSYQEWIYADDSERILDITIGGLDLPLDPTLKFHGRLDKGAAGADHDEGIITSLNASLPGFSFAGLDFAIPVSVAFATDGYHGGDSGYGLLFNRALHQCPLDWSLVIKRRIDLLPYRGRCHPPGGGQRG